MSRPAQLQQQIDHVKKLQDELLNPTPEGGNTDEPKEPVEPTEQHVQPVVQEPPVSISKEEYDRLEQKYSTLQGMHRADQARFREQLSTLNATVHNLESRLLAEQQQLPKEPTKYVTAQDEEEYGDTVEMVRRAAREEAEAFALKREEVLLARIAELERNTNHLQNTVVPVVDDINRSQIEAVKSQFWSAIDTQVPNWRTINETQAFKDWLLEEDRVTGATRQQFLSEARANYIPTRVIAIFKEWERSQAGGPTPAPKSQSELEKFVAPGTSRSTTPNDNSKRKWTREDISKFYSDVVTGKYAGKAEEKKKLEDDIIAAQGEGRIV